MVQRPTAFCCQFFDDGGKGQIVVAGTMAVYEARDDRRGVLHFAIKIRRAMYAQGSGNYGDLGAKTTSVSVRLRSIRVNLPNPSDNGAYARFPMKRIGGSKAYREDALLRQRETSSIEFPKMFSGPGDLLRSRLRFSPVTR